MKDLGEVILEVKIKRTFVHTSLSQFYYYMKNVFKTFNIFML